MSTSRPYDSPKRAAAAAATRARILDAFREQLVEQLRDTLSPTDAARQAGCSVRTVHDHFPSEQSRIDALAERLEREIYPEPVPLPTSAEELPEHYRTIHRAALSSELATTLLTHGGAAWREVRARRRTARLDAVRRAVEQVGASRAATEDAAGVLLALAGGEVTISMRDRFGVDPARIPDAIAHTVELIVDDLTSTV